jgi:hypothetical protein
MCYERINIRLLILYFIDDIDTREIIAEVEIFYWR